MTGIHIFSNLIYNAWFFGLPLLALLTILYVILRRKLCTGKSLSRKHLCTARKSSTEREGK
jgi:hypothetical protein